MKKTRIQKFLDAVPPNTKLVVSEDAGDADFVVCVLAVEKTPYTDNVVDYCCKCGAMVQHRPHVPKGPKRICYKCIPEYEKKLDSVIISPNTAMDLVAYAIKKSRH